MNRKSGFFAECVPLFWPAKIVLKREGGSDSNPFGPLFYEADRRKFRKTKANRGWQTAPVILDLEKENDTSPYCYFAVWYDLKAARRIADIKNLPLEIF